MVFQVVGNVGALNYFDYLSIGTGLDAVTVVANRSTSACLRRMCDSSITHVGYVSHTSEQFGSTYNFKPSWSVSAHSIAVLYGIWIN